MTNVGFTTGSLYKTAIPFNERIKLYYSLGADAIELSFATPKHLFDISISEELKHDVNKYSYVSIHAPWKEIRYGDNDATKRILQKLRQWCGVIPIGGIVLHPDTIGNFEMLDNSELPFVIENMDRRKAYGTHPDQFRDLVLKYNIGFVMDVQHAFEHDSSMQLAREFLGVMGDRLQHMHVSGYSKSEIHCPTHYAVNREAITEILEMNIDVPKILEGIISADVYKTIRDELTYIQSFEG